MNSLALVGGSGGSSGPGFWAILAVIVVIAIVMAARVFSRRRRAAQEDPVVFDGKGPAVEWFPRFMRPWVNRFFARRGWPEPYDQNLDKIPRRER